MQAPTLAAVGNCRAGPPTKVYRLSTFLFEGGELNVSEDCKKQRIKLGNTAKLTLLGVSGFLFIVSGTAFVRSRAQDRFPLKAATMQIRIYTQKPDGSIEEKGTRTFYQAADGGYSVIRRDKAGHIVNTIIGDKTQNATFLVVGEEATKVQTGFGQTTATQVREYKGMRGYAGEMVLFGEVAYIERTTQEQNGANSEVVTIPSLKHPVKTITFNDDGSQTIEEAVSVVWGAPDSEKVKLNPRVRVTGEVDLLKKSTEGKHQ